MIIDELRKARNKQPFVRFTIRMADGTTVTVRHPDNLAWNEDSGTVACVSDDGTDVIDLYLITSLGLERAGKKKKNS